MNTYLYAPAVSCDEIHKEKRQMDTRVCPPSLAPRNSVLHLTANSDGRAESLAEPRLTPQRFGVIAPSETKIGQISYKDFHKFELRGKSHHKQRAGGFEFDSALY